LPNRKSNVLSREEETYFSKFKKKKKKIEGIHVSIIVKKEEKAEREETIIEKLAKNMCIQNYMNLI